MLRYYLSTISVAHRSEYWPLTSHVSLPFSSLNGKQKPDKRSKHSCKASHIKCNSHFKLEEKKGLLNLAESWSHLEEELNT